MLALARQDQAGARRTVTQVAQLVLSASPEEGPFPVLADSDGAVAKAYGVANFNETEYDTPAVFILDRQGQIVWSEIASDVSNQARPGASDILREVP